LETEDYGWEIIDPIHPYLIPEPQQEDIEKHLAGLHDQRTHGSWSAGQGGAGVDITEEMDKLFFDDNFELNKETQDLITLMNETEVAAGKSYGDNALKIIAERQGFTDKPKSVETIEDLQEIQKTEGGRLVYRGLADFSQKAIDMGMARDPALYDDTANIPITYSAQQAINDFREGEYYAGWGMFGNGTYTTSSVDTASSYANTVEESEGKLGNGRVMAMLIPKSAKMPSESEVKAVVKALNYTSIESTHENNIGRVLATRGYQAYDSGYVQSDKMGNIVILDRSMLTVAKETRS
jgi:hypothetical protein